MSPRQKYGFSPSFWYEERALNELSDREMERLIAETALAFDFSPCPNCGAMPDVDWIDVSTKWERRFIPGLLSCSDRCDQREPEKYLAAVRGWSPVSVVGDGDDA